MIAKFGKLSLRVELERLQDEVVVEVKRMTILFPGRMVDRLDAAKEKTGLRWSHMIRAAVDAYLRGLGV